MRISLDHLEAFHFRAQDEDGVTLELDGGDTRHSLSPMQVVAAAAGTCSAIDLVDILQKGRLTIDDLDVVVEADRAEEPPRVFTKMHLHYALEGELPPEKVRRAVQLSLDKYCSVSNMLEGTVELTASFSVNGEEYDLDRSA